MTTYYLDCEFDGHKGNLLSLALVREDGYSLYLVVNTWASDPWVLKHVLPIMDCHSAHVYNKVKPNDVGAAIRAWLDPVNNFCVVADSPVDIARFCAALSTDSDGGWCSVNYETITFEVRNVSCYPTVLKGAVQHNAWWDACALRAVFCETDDAFYEGRAMRDNKSTCGDLDYEI